jgi:predicted nucleic-acid-binding protein
MFESVMRAVDTNILVRLIAQDDPPQVASAYRFIKNGVWASHLAVVETAWVLASAYAFTPGQLISAIEMLLAEKDLFVQDADVVAAALDLFRARPALGFTDCMMLETARKFGHLPLGTFDRGLGKVDGAQKL